MLVAVHVATALAVTRPGLPVWRLALLPRSLPHRISVGGQYAALVPVEPWRLCTTVLLHVDAIHLALNVTALLAMGPLLEPRVGSVRWAAWFAIGGVGGAVASHLAGVRLSDGASGGAFALVGAALVIGWRRRATLSPEDRTLLGPVLGGFLALNVVLTLALPQINAAAHLGGLAVGVVLALASELPGSRIAEGIALAAFVVTCALGWGLLAMG